MMNKRRGRIAIGIRELAVGAVALAAFSLAVLLTVVLATVLLRRGEPPSALAPATADTSEVVPAASPSAVLGASPTAPAGAIIHTVQPGETLIGIASTYGVPLELLQSANHLKNPSTIFPGQQLIIPDTTILTPRMPLGTLSPTAGPTLDPSNPANLSVLSGWPRSLSDGTPDQLSANYPLTVARPRFQLHYQPGTYQDKHLDEVVSRVERALSNVESRLGVHLEGQFDVYAAGTLFAGDDANLRGQSRSRDRRLFFLSDGTGTPAENDYVVTHELTHLLAWNTWGSPSSTMLSEGLATYEGKAELESGGFLPYDQLCLGILAAGQLPPLTTIERDYQSFQGHIEDRFTYFGSACFIQYLIDTYGLEPMSRLYHSSDYQGLYGKSLGELDQEWRASILARRSSLTLDIGALVSFTQEVTAAYDYVFKNYDNSASMQQAYLAVDQARIALWQGDYASTRRWLDAVYQTTGLTPQAALPAPQ